VRKAFLAVAALVAFVVVAGAIVYTVPALRDEAEWRWAAFKDAEDAYAAYLRERPDGRHAEEARQRHDEKVFDRAAAGDTIRDYEAYLKVYARGRHAGDARRRIDALHWQTARKKNTVEAYQAYLATSPEGAYVAEAQTRFRDLRWQRTAARIASLACSGGASRRVPLYRAPGLSATLAAKRTPFYISYVVRITSAPTTGYGVIARVPCEELDVLGGTEERGWAFVSLKGKPAVKGWVDVPKASRVKWSIVPRVPADRLLTESRRLPDLAFGAQTQSFKVGDECTNLGDVNVYDLVLRNAGEGPGPTAARLRISPRVPHYVEGRRVDTTSFVTLRFARPWLPGESLTVSGIPFESSVQLDPGGAVRESDEGNNSLSLSRPGSFYFSCGPIRRP
jgi:hypothetical protein